MKNIRIATRGSKLALVQAELIKGLIEKKGYNAQINIIHTKGDKDQNRSLQEIGGDGLFIRELEKALLAGEADIAVHSGKDLPYRLISGLVVVCTPKAEPSNDCVIQIKGKEKELSDKLKIGTGSPRRISELKKISPFSEFLPLRGNIDTRLSKLMNNGYDAIVLARAGLNRLKPNLDDFTIRDLTIEEMIPAACQGIIAVECRDNDEETLKLLSSINDEVTYERFVLERAVFTGLEADCSTAIGVNAQIENDKITLRCLLDDKKLILEDSVQNRNELINKMINEMRKK